MTEILQKEAVGMSDVKDELSRIEKRDGELSFRAQRTKEYLNAVKLSRKTKAKELREAIEKLEIPRLKDTHITKLVDLMPSSDAEIKVILQGYTLTVSNDNVSKIAHIFKDAAPKKKAVKEDEE
jgi:DNA-directed RNA polymerase subunit F